MAADPVESAEASRERQEDEVDALSSIFGDDFVLLSGIHGRRDAFSFDVKLRLAILRVRFPKLYPESSPLASVSVRPAPPDSNGDDACRTFSPSRAQCALLTKYAIRFCLENQGFEVVYSLVESVQARLASLAEEATASALALSSSQLADAPATGQLLILLIDHMNDSRGYTKKLSLWAKQLGLTGMQLFRYPSSASPAEHRVEGVVVLLHGDNRKDISEFLCRLRTHKVDVNGRGDACKERKSTVLTQIDVEHPPSCLCQDFLLQQHQQQQHYVISQYETTEDVVDFFRLPQHGLLEVPCAVIADALQKRF